VPLTSADQAAGYWWELSMRQVETSRTMVFAAPRQARAFFEALIADNLDLGRPEHVEILFKRDPRGRKPKDQAGGTFRTAIDRNSQGVTINAFWRHSRVKQYLKDGRALRTAGQRAGRRQPLAGSAGTPGRRRAAPGRLSPFTGHTRARPVLIPLRPHRVSAWQ
jgi:hypothetical protein